MWTKEVQDTWFRVLFRLMDDGWEGNDINLEEAIIRDPEFIAAQKASFPVSGEVSEERLTRAQAWVDSIMEG